MCKHIQKNSNICLKTMESNNLKKHMKIHKNETLDKVFPNRQKQDATQINHNLETCTKNQELGRGITIIQGLKGFDLNMRDDFKFQDYQQQEYKQTKITTWDEN